MQTITMGQAVRQALAEEMRRDPNVFIAGEGIGVSIHESPVMPTYGLLKEFGPDRVKDTPVSEQAIADWPWGLPSWPAAGLEVCAARFLPWPPTRL